MTNAPEPPRPGPPRRPRLDDEPAVSQAADRSDLYTSEAQEETLRLLVATRAAFDRHATDVRDGFAKVFQRLDHLDEDIRSVRQVQVTQGNALLSHRSTLEAIYDRIGQAESGLQQVRSMAQIADMPKFVGEVIAEVERLKATDRELRASDEELKKKTEQLSLADVAQDKLLADHESRLTTFAKRFGPAALVGSVVTGVLRFLWDIYKTGQWPW